jgi:hypothetical protein
MCNVYSFQVLRELIPAILWIWHEFGQEVKLACCMLMLLKCLRNNEISLTKISEYKFIVRSSYVMCWRWGNISDEVECSKVLVM